MIETPTGANRLGYMASLDGVRAFAVLVVMGAHSNLAEFRGGGVGVDIFFVLSGFLITKLLLQEFERHGRIALVKFYARRALRLVPALVLVLVAVILYAELAADAETRRILWQEVVTAALYLRDLTLIYGYPDGDIFLGHTWSLGLEEQFYFLWPPVLAWCLRRGAGVRGLLLTTAGAAVALSLLPLVLTPSRLGTFLSLRPGALVFGVALAFVYHAVPAPKTRTPRRLLRLAAYLSAGYLAATVVFPEAARMGGGQRDQFLVLAAATLLLAGLVYAPPELMRRVLEFPVFIALGKISYGLYLWHLPIFRWFNRFGPELNPKVHILLEFGLTLAVASASYWFVERRFLKMKPR